LTRELEVDRLGAYPPIGRHWAEESFIIADREHLKQVDETDGGELIEVEVLIEIGSSQCVYGRGCSLEV